MALLAVSVAALKVGVTQAVFTDMESTRVLLEAGIWTSNNCTYTLGYWKNHPNNWPVEEITFGNVTCSKMEATAILETSPQSDATYILAHQLISAKLNVLNGADPSVIEGTITDADHWLLQYPLGSNPPEPERLVGIILSENLDNYNSGVIGPGHCEVSE